MSVPIEKSPFQGIVPCKHALEKDSEIICSKYANQGMLCCGRDRCNQYAETGLSCFRDYTGRNIRASWIKVSDEICYWYICSRCRNRILLNRYGSESFTRYCPNCGSRMYEKDEELQDIPTGIYQHFKGSYYNVLAVAEHSETHEKLVVYQALYGSYKIYARPLKMFTEIVEDLANSYRGPRFYKVEKLIE